MVAPRMGIFIYLYMLTDRGSKVDNLSVGLAAVPHRQEGRGLQRRHPWVGFNAVAVARIACHHSDVSVLGSFGRGDAVDCSVDCKTA